MTVIRSNAQWGNLGSLAFLVPERWRLAPEYALCVSGSKGMHITWSEEPFDEAQAQLFLEKKRALAKAMFAGDAQIGEIEPAPSITWPTYGFQMRWIAEPTVQGLAVVLRPAAALVIRYRLTREQAAQVQLLIQSIRPLYDAAPPGPGRYEAFNCSFYSPWELTAPTETYLTSFDMSRRIEMTWGARRYSMPPEPNWSHPEIPGPVTVLDVHSTTTAAGTEPPAWAGQPSQPLIALHVLRHEAQGTPEAQGTTDQPSATGSSDGPIPLLWYQAWGQHDLGALSLELRCCPAAAVEDDETWRRFISSIHVR